MGCWRSARRASSSRSCSQTCTSEWLRPSAKQLRFNSKRMRAAQYGCVGGSLRVRVQAHAWPPPGPWHRVPRARLLNNSHRKTLSQLPQVWHALQEGQPLLLLPQLGAAAAVCAFHPGWYPRGGEGVEWGEQGAAASSSGSCSRLLRCTTVHRTHCRGDCAAGRNTLSEDGSEAPFHQPLHTQANPHEQTQHNLAHRPPLPPRRLCCWTPTRSQRTARLRCVTPASATTAPCWLTR